MIEHTPKPSEEDIPIRQSVTKRLIGIDSKSSVQEAAQRMINFKIDSLVVSLVFLISLTDVFSVSIPAISTV